MTGSSRLVKAPLSAKYPLDQETLRELLLREDWDCVSQPFINELCSLCPRGLGMSSALRGVKQAGR